MGGNQGKTTILGDKQPVEKGIHINENSGGDSKNAALGARTWTVIGQTYQLENAVTH